MKQLMMMALMMCSTLVSFGQDTLRYSDISTENKPRGSYLYYLSKDGSVYSVGDNVFGPGKVLKKMEYDQFMSIPQSEINLGIHKFKKQHRTGNHLIIAGIASSIIGSLLIVSSTKPSTVISTSSSETITTYPSGVFFTAAGGALLTAGFVVNIDSFRHLK